MNPGRRELREREKKRKEKRQWIGWGYLVPSPSWQTDSQLSWQKRHNYLILIVKKVWSNCVKSCRSRFQGPSTICNLDFSYEVLFK
jgi:hypothetical protein